MIAEVYHTRGEAFAVAVWHLRRVHAGVEVPCGTLGVVASSIDTIKKKL